MSDLSRQVGSRLKLRRKAVGLTVKALAEASGVSARYILSAEAGQANLSLDKLNAICARLGVPITAMVSDGRRGDIDEILVERSAEELGAVAEWLRNTYGGRHRPLIALLGVRGAGKTAVGRALAENLSAPFHELDARIEGLSGLSLAEIFAVHGEPYYRRIEFEALSEVIKSSEPAVIATGGGLVTDERNFTCLKQGATTVWLKASAEEHWDRVIRQGDRRPMRDHPQAMAELRTLLAERAPLYGQADHIVSTTGRSIQEIVKEIEQIF
jgi:XRE family transcriptional regulator, aerobic/anaerobic benzoate catabolism transcriptional regulator